MAKEYLAILDTPKRYHGINLVVDIIALARQHRCTHLVHVSGFRALNALHILWFELASS